MGTPKRLFTAFSFHLRNSPIIKQRKRG